MEFGGIRGILMLLLMAAFIGLWIWAWSSKRKQTFNQASMLPLEEDQEITAAGHADKDEE